MLFHSAQEPCIMKRVNTQHLLLLHYLLYITVCTVLLQASTPHCASENQNPLTAIFLNISHYLSLAWYPCAMCTLHMPSIILMFPFHIVSILYLIFDFCSIRVGYLDLIVQVLVLVQPDARVRDCWLEDTRVLMLILTKKHYSNLLVNITST